MYNDELNTRSKIVHSNLTIRNDYVFRLVQILYPRIYETLSQLWKKSKEMKPLKEDSVLITFQIELKQIPLWNKDQIEKEYNRILKKSKISDYSMKELINTVFIMYARSMASIRDGDTKIDLPIPEPDTFVHHVYQNVARSFYENPRLLEDRDDRITFIDREKNYNNSVKKINESIEKTIRIMLPLDKILIIPPSPPQELFLDTDSDSDSQYSTQVNGHTEDVSTVEDNDDNGENRPKEIRFEDDDTTKEPEENGDHYQPIEEVSFPPLEANDFSLDHSDAEDPWNFNKKDKNENSDIIQVELKDKKGDVVDDKEISIPLPIPNKNTSQLFDSSEFY